MTAARFAGVERAPAAGRKPGHPPPAREAPNC